MMQLQSLARVIIGKKCVSTTENGDRVCPERVSQRMCYRNTNDDNIGSRVQFRIRKNVLLGRIKQE